MQTMLIFVESETASSDALFVNGLKGPIITEKKSLFKLTDFHKIKIKSLTANFRQKLRNNRTTIMQKIDNFTIIKAHHDFSKERPKDESVIDNIFHPPPPNKVQSPISTIQS